MEKKRRHYDLDTIKATFTSVATLNISRTAVRDTRALELSLEDIVAMIQAMSGAHFIKSMTSDLDSSIWQDVYNVPFGALVLYVKFTTDPQGYLLISCKEK